MPNKSRSQYWIYGMMAVLLCTATNTVKAQETIDTPALMVELNTAQTLDGACRLSFLIKNEHPSDIKSVVYETVLFNADGSVNQLTLFDFGLLPSSRPRVRQFDVQGVVCSDLGQLLINDANNCESTDLDPSICVSTLDLRSRTEIEVLG